MTPAPALDLTTSLRGDFPRQIYAPPVRGGPEPPPHPRTPPPLQTPQPTRGTYAPLCQRRNTRPASNSPGRGGGGGLAETRGAVKMRQGYAVVRSQMLRMKFPDGPPKTPFPYPLKGLNWNVFLAWVVHPPPPCPLSDRTRRCMPRSQTAWRRSECGAPMPDFPNERHSVGP